jgi:sulfate adenylyltransferase
MKKIKISKNDEQDLYNLHYGIYAPLQGFLKEKDFLSVLEKMRLADGNIWSIPIAIQLNQEDAKGLNNGDNILLINKNREKIAILNNINIYFFDKSEYCRWIYDTDNPLHPGVKTVLEGGDLMLGGDIKEIIKEPEKNDHFFTPAKTKEIFRKNDWQQIVAFQTRNVPHRSHEHLQKKALEKVDAIFIQPVTGEKKAGDFKDELIIKSYEKLLANYFPENKYHLGVLPLKMRYAGPREALMHALIRRNFGCTHMIIGRDHAGVGDFYHPFAAQEIFDQFNTEELGIEIFKFGDVHYCPLCRDTTFEHDCPHPKNNYLKISGTKIREMIKKRETPPPEFTRPEIAEIIIKHENPFVGQA